jgi:multidrug efflux pump subunit AcrA (membrane-fusion protein)
MAESASQLSEPAEPASTDSISSKSTGHESISQGVLFNVVIPLLLLFGGAFVVWILGSVEPEQRPPIDTTRTGRLQALPPVRVERLQSLESTGQQLKLQVDGNVVPFREARVAAEVAGRVIFKSDQCEAGSYVKKDQLLMQLDPTDYELEVQRLTRMKEQEYAALSEVDQEMANTQPLIELAEQDVQLQQKEVKRLTTLPEGFASPAEIDRANRALLAANAELVSANNQLKLLAKRRVSLEASERLAATQLKAAEVNLKRAEIRAPIEGVIVREDADLNTFVSRGSMLITIEDTSKVEVATSLRMDQLYWILDQQRQRDDQSSRGYDLPETPAIIEYELSGREGVIYRWKGRLLSYDGIGVDPVTRTVPVRVVVDNPTEYIDERGETQHVDGATALVRGMYVRVNLLIQPKTRLVVIPSRALQPGNRVLQFVPDESVLEMAGPIESASGSTALDSTKTTLASGNNDSFHPNLWEPGRVFVRRAVNPVDSLAATEANLAEQTGSESAFTNANRMWVCEVDDPALTGGSYVVVSPLGSVSEKAFPVRAEREGMTDTPAGDPATDEPSVVTNMDSAEDA